MYSISSSIVDFGSVGITYHIITTNLHDHGYLRWSWFWNVYENWFLEALNVRSSLIIISQLYKLKYQAWIQSPDFSYSPFSGHKRYFSFINIFFTNVSYLVSKVRPRYITSLSRCSWVTKKLEDFSSSNFFPFLYGSSVVPSAPALIRLTFLHQRADIVGAYFPMMLWQRHHRTCGYSNLYWLVWPG